MAANLIYKAHYSLDFLLAKVKSLHLLLLVFRQDISCG